MEKNTNTSSFYWSFDYYPKSEKARRLSSNLFSSLKLGIGTTNRLSQKQKQQSTTAMADVDKSGRFLKGYSGNAGGRPKDEHNIAALARSYSTEAIETLVDLMRNARDDRVRGTAAQALLDRGFGKPKVEIQNTNADFRDALAQVGKVLDEKRHEEMSTAADIVLTSQ